MNTDGCESRSASRHGRGDWSPSFGGTPIQLTSEAMSSLVQSLLHGLTTDSDVPAEPLDKYIAIKRLHPYKNGTDMREFIQTLEIEFDQARVDPREYKRILISELSPKTKDICVDLITDSQVG